MGCVLEACGQLKPGAPADGLLEVRLLLHSAGRTVGVDGTRTPEEMGMQTDDGDDNEDDEQRCQGMRGLERLRREGEVGKQNKDKGRGKRRGGRTMDGESPKERSETKTLSIKGRPIPPLPLRTRQAMTKLRATRHH